MRNIGNTGAAVAASFAQPDLPRRGRTRNVGAWRAGVEARSQHAFVSPITQAREKNRKRELAAARGPLSEPIPLPRPVHKPLPKAPAKSNPPAKPARPAQPSPGRRRPAAERLVARLGEVKAAYAAGKSLDELAVIFTCDKTTVRRVLVEAGVTIRPAAGRTRSKAYAAEVIRLYVEEQLSPAVIGARVGRTPKTVYDVLRQAGVPTRRSQAAATTEGVSA